ncbi:MAG TPA: SurA N-terminal domain-containing protein [Thermoanaerobaculales bacterium]|nr:SurA N-terminal domain-containing protein [Thermoanaerobaculales bacterium]HPA79270.1 SurA N-terminal domain-containing protein [Thermoanaerobaculales bacterium]HQL29720.1 SurA N-terminal domain-containing protein [Thermoanaerobaculales bacterium]HQN95976.1 SurA N-terminal domain-containing protein [Thermoanaerobaculales bacterium]HQP42792.1 SurA N-terminal domain-containing protein [Thermoanaerobaculales bacterium]
MLHPTLRSLSAAAFAAAIGVASVAWCGDRELVEAILVRVNDRIVTVSDFRERLTAELSQLPSPPEGAARERFARELFTTVVDELILLERAREKKLTIDDEMVDKAIGELREQNQLQDDAAFKAALASAGLTEQALRERYRHNMLLQRAVQSEIKPTEITEEEIRQRYEADKEQFRVPAKAELEQVFLPVAADGSDRRQVMRTAQGLVERVRGGADLRAEATLAGGEVQELGAIPVADMREDLQRVLEPLADNGLTDPLETPGGVQIVRLVRRIPAGYQPFEEVEESIRRQLSQGAYQDQTKGMVDRLKGEYLVEIHEDRLEMIIAQLRGA